MVMWFRLAGVLAVTVAALGALDYWGAFAAGRAATEPQDVAHRAGELFWRMIFILVVATALLAAVRRWTEQLRRGR